MSWIMMSYPLGDASLVTPVWAHPALTPQPKVVATPEVPAGGWTIYIDIDLFIDRQLDTFALMFHNGPAGGAWRMFGRPHAAGAPGAAFEDDPATLLFAWEPWGERPLSADGVFQHQRAHALHLLPDPLQLRWLRIYIHWPGPADLNPFHLGLIRIGKRLEPGRDTSEMRGFDWGGGRRMADSSEVRTHDGGEKSAWRRAVVPEVRGTWSHLTDAELRELEAIVMAAGRTQPVLLGESADTLGALGEPGRLHYGTLVEADYFERRQANKNRFEVRLSNML